MSMEYNWLCIKRKMHLPYVDGEVLCYNRRHEAADFQKSLIATMNFIFCYVIVFHVFWVLGIDWPKHAVSGQNLFVTD